jgi:hypothetical protein
MRGQNDSTQYLVDMLDPLSRLQGLGKGFRHNSLVSLGLFFSPKG